MKPYTMSASGRTGRIEIYDRIGSTWFEEGITASQFSKDLAALGDVKTLDVRINTLGGSVVEGAAIYTQLVDHPARVEVVVDGYAMSMGSAIAMAGDSIKMVEFGLMMIHRPQSSLRGNADQFREEADILDKFERTLSKIYTRRTGLSDQKLAELLKGSDDADGTYMDAEEAKALGFIDEIVEAKGQPQASIDPAAAAQFKGMTQHASRFLAQPQQHKPTMLDRIAGRNLPRDMTADVVQLRAENAELTGNLQALREENATLRQQGAHSTEAAVLAERQRILGIQMHGEQMGVDATQYVMEGTDPAVAAKQMLNIKAAVDDATANMPRVSDETPGGYTGLTLNVQGIYDRRAASKAHQ